MSTANFPAVLPESRPEAREVTPTTVPELPVASWHYPELGVSMTVADPAARPDAFTEYFHGAVRSYSRFGVTDALQDDPHSCALDTVLFWTIDDDSGRMIGGARAKGPLRGADDSHAAVEWAGQPGERAVRKMIDDRAPFGVLEVKGAWLDAGAGGGDRGLAQLIARCGFQGLAMLGLDFFMASSAAHVLERWGTSGGLVSPIPATPYPDERYQTRLMWWDRRTFARHGHPSQVAATLREMADVRRIAETDADTAGVGAVLVGAGRG